MADQEARRWLVFGRVQGIGYRQFAQQAAQALGVRGWVRNQPDGTVEIQAAAPPAALEQLKAELRRGPRGAQVEDIEEEPLVQVPTWQRFNIVF